MADYREVRHERLYTKEPGTERLRKTSAARLRHLLGTGWREVDRWYHDRFITVKVERTGVAPRMIKLPKPEPAPQRPPRMGDRGPRGGGGRPGPGGPSRGAGPRPTPGR